MAASVRDILGFQVVWLICALGAARGYGEPGMLAAGLLVLWSFWRAPSPAPAKATLIAAGVLGATAETFLVASGLVRYAAAWPSANLVPAWLVALWLAYATTMPALAMLLGRQPLLKASLIGALLAPVAYLAGERLGALEFLAPTWLGPVAVAAVWAVASPTLLAIDLNRADR